MSRAETPPEGGGTVTDARFPDRWLHDMRILKLSDRDFRAYAMSLVFAVTNRTDGHLDADHLRFIPGGVADTSVKALLESGLWVKQADGWLIQDFLATQTSAAQLLANEEYTAREKIRKAKANKGRTRKDRAGSARAEVARDPGEDRDRTRQERTGREADKSENEQFSGSDADQMAASRPGALGKCLACGHREPLSPVGRCPSCEEWDAPIEEAS